MPLILAPYTFGTDLTGPPTTAGGGYYLRRHRYLAWLAMLVLVFLC